MLRLKAIIAELRSDVVAHDDHRELTQHCTICDLLRGMHRKYGDEVNIYIAEQLQPIVKNWDAIDNIEAYHEEILMRGAEYIADPQCDNGCSAYVYVMKISTTLPQMNVIAPMLAALLPHLRSGSYAHFNVSREILWHEHGQLRDYMVIPFGG